MKYQDGDWLRGQIEEKNRTLTSIADECDVSIVTIQRWRDKFGIGDWEPPMSEDELRRLHHDEKMKLSEIAEHTGHSHITIDRSFGQHGVERRYYRDGERNPAWRGGYDDDWRRTSEYRQTRKEAMDRADNRCEECGSDENLHIHHITAVSDGGDKFDTANVTVLCKECHGEVHGKKFPH